MIIDKAPKSGFAKKSVERVQNFFVGRNKNTHGGAASFADIFFPSSAAAPSKVPAKARYALKPITDICVFGGKSPAAGARFLAVADELGEEMVHAKLALIYGGSPSGPIDRLAKAVLAGGGHVSAVFVGKLPLRALPPQASGNFYPAVASDVETRKEVMVNSADGVVVLPGGWGTIDEYVYLMTRAARHKKVVFVNTDGFFAPLADFVKAMGQAGFTPASDSVVLRDTPKEALQYLIEPKKI